MPRREETPARLRSHAILESGRAYFARKDYPAALERFEQAVALDPTYERAAAARALALIKLGRSREALGVCDAILKKNPSYALAYSTRGAAQQQLNLIAEARTSYETAARLEPNNPFVLYNFACFWARAGKTAETRECLARALQLDPKMNIVASVDEDFQNVRDEAWFQELVAFRRP